ncbi:hypothetical protein [Herbiconiux daphne]|uniref:Lipoprotein n=1 Tax=Herbiconiux daphne TaxID=2970914 RepID=A0ABT2H062_9MICO|nr:hypothetical protein [Herbiconiux daphne]MCS5732701.1 hypothetical protein [Herbiconiux daphne]
MKMRKSALLAIPALAFAFVLTGCTLPGPMANFSGLPGEEQIAGESEPDDSGLQAFWLNEGDSIAVAVSGSSTCPVIGSRLNVIDPAGEGNVVEIVPVAQPADQICTMDYVPHTTTFPTPNDVTTTEPLVVRVGDKEVTVPIK